MISQVLDPPGASWPAIAVPRGRAAEVFMHYGLTGDGSSAWTQLYEHIAGVTAAALTIANRMALPTRHIEAVRVGALLHDATKRRDIESYGTLASSHANTDRSLALTMRAAGYPQDVITAAMNTGRDDRIFSSGRERRASIEQKGVIGAIVGLADTRSSGAHFVSLDQAQADYLARKKDAESVSFFTKYWRPYYEAVEDYLTENSPGLRLDISDEQVYNETVCPEVFGPGASSFCRRNFPFREPLP